MTYAGAPQYFSIAWTTSSRVAVLLFKPKRTKSEILCQLSERGDADAVYKAVGFIEFLRRGVE